nr:unnamed protein product [Callosobruchus chinensis]
MENKCTISVKDDIERRRLKWYGYINRMCENRWTKKILNWKSPLRRQRGRSPEELEKQLDMEKRDMTDQD